MAPSTTIPMPTAGPGRTATSGTAANAAPRTATASGVHGGHSAARPAVLVGLVIALALVWSVAGWLAGPGSGVDPVGAGTTSAARTVVVVQPGDTLWSIAAEIDPGADVRATVDRLAERNGGTSLTVGQRLVVSE